MLKKIAAIAVITIMLSGIFGLAACIDDNVANPFTLEQIQTFLEEKYGEEFVFGKKEFDDKKGSFSKFVYSYSPKSNPELGFYVVDQTIQAHEIKHWDRILNDTYPHALLKADSDNLLSLCGKLTIKISAFEDLFDYAKTYYDKNAPCIINLAINTANEFEEADSIAEQLFDVANYVSENVSKYKCEKLELQVSLLSAKITLFRDNSVCSFESVLDFVYNQMKRSVHRRNNGDGGICCQVYFLEKAYTSLI